MLVISGVINYVDRSTLSMAEQPICAELGLTTTEMGFLLSAFSWSYAFAQLPTGALVDKVGPRILLAAGLALWSVAQACGGLVTSMRQFVATRIAIGIGKAPQFPTGAPWSAIGTTSASADCRPAFLTHRRVSGRRWHPLS